MKTKIMKTIASSTEIDDIVREKLQHYLSTHTKITLSLQLSQHKLSIKILDPRARVLDTTNLEMSDMQSLIVQSELSNHIESLLEHELPLIKTGSSILRTDDINGILWFMVGSYDIPNTAKDDHTIEKVLKGFLAAGYDVRKSNVSIQIENILIPTLRATKRCLDPTSFLIEESQVRKLKITRNERQNLEMLLEQAIIALQK